MAIKHRKRGRPRLARYTEKAFEPYVKAIGQLTLAWNALHETLAYTFLLLLAGMLREVDRNTGPRTQGIWNSVNSDRTRRSFLRIAIKEATASERRAHPRLVDDMLWVLDLADKLGEVRNDAVHSPLLLRRADAETLTGGAGAENLIVPDLLMGNPRALRLQGKDLLAEFRWCRQSALVCQEFVVEINRALSSIGYPWPARPPVPPRGQKTMRSRTAA